ncbi:STAS domain-containing protein [Streptomyces sp. NPDC018045]|uniref:STAS domain-containing protein n=1 Tax=Streptomyces sp. NPDC018045 TaxID=3365037 RepID=UPI0037B69223
MPNHTGRSAPRAGDIMYLSNYHIADRLVIEVPEIIDIANTGQVAAGLQGLLREPEANGVVIDLRAPIITVAGLQTLLSCQRTAREHGVTLSVAADRPMVRKAFRLTGVHRTIPLHSSLEDALAA